MSIWEENPTRRELILGVTNSLWERRDSIDLGEIDGAYFWTVCHDSQIRGLKELLRAEKTEDWDRQVLDRLAEITRGIPFLHHWIFEGKVPRLRHSMFSLFKATQVDSTMSNEIIVRGLQDSFPIIDRFWVRLTVFDQAWTGKRVEREIRDQLALRTDDGGDSLLDAVINGRIRGLDPHKASASPHLGDSEFSSISLRFCESGELTIKRQEIIQTYPLGSERWAPVNMPNIWVTVQLPLPPEGLIAANYDAIAREKRKWHLKLAGNEKNQSNEAAIRAWAVGLLCNDGMLVTSAISEVEDRLGLYPYSETRFNQDRKELLSRVPEAEPFIFSKAKLRRPSLSS